MKNRKTSSLRLKSDSRISSLSDLFNTNAEELCEVSIYMFEVIEILRNSPMYSNNESLSKYIDLCRVIDFTKIADMLHLITHYGAVSDRALEECTDAKEAGRLMTRKSYTDIYLNLYQLDSIDCELDQMYPDPITTKDRAKWYSAASNLLINALMGAKVQIDKLSHKLYFTNHSGERVFIENFTAQSFVSFLDIVLHTSKSFGIQIDWTTDLLNKFVNSILETETFSTDSIANDIIQFNDCYVENGEFKVGKYQYIPRFYIERDIWEVVESRRVSKRVQEIDDFLLHLSDYDDDTVAVFLSRMSTFLMNSETLKSAYSNTINVLYGASGQNGKSLFLSILKKIFNPENIMYAGLRDFNNRNYSLPQMCQSLLVVDEDASDLQLDSDATSAIKQFTHGQTMYVRSIYEKVKSYRPRAMVVACTNHMPTAVDKSDGFNRRFSIFTQTSKLVNRDHKRSEDWFKTIKSFEASQYLLELLVLAHLENMRRESLLENSERMKEINEDFVEKNDSAVMYIRSVGLKEIINKPVKMVRENYERWCEDNGVVALKNKFNTTLETKFGLKSKLINVKNLALDESDLLANGFKSDMRQIRSWVHSDEELTKKYLDMYRFSMDQTNDLDDLYKLSSTDPIRKLTSDIVELIDSKNEVSDRTDDEIIHRISILMNEESYQRQSSVISSVRSRLKSLYKTEIKTVSDLTKDEYDRYISIGQYSKSLTEALKDPRRQVLIYREKK